MNKLTKYLVAAACLIGMSQLIQVASAGAWTIGGPYNGRLESVSVNTYCGSRDGCAVVSGWAVDQGGLGWDLAYPSDDIWITTATSYLPQVATISTPQKVSCWEVLIQRYFVRTSLVRTQV